MYIHIIIITPLRLFCIIIIIIILFFSQPPFITSDTSPFLFVSHLFPTDGAQSNRFGIVSLARVCACGCVRNFRIRVLPGQNVCEMTRAGDKSPNDLFE